MDLKVRLDDERGKAARALAMIQHLPSDTPGALDKLGQLVNSAGSMIKKFDEERKREVQPLNDAVKEINSWFRPITDFYTSAQKALKDKISRAVEAQEQARRAALAEVAESVENASAEAFAIAHAPVHAPSNVTMREVVTYVVQDADLIPQEYWVMQLNHEAIKRDNAAGKVIPGVLRVVSKAVASRG
jgi:hypothetical protein